MRNTAFALILLALASPAFAHNPDLLVRDRTGRMVERLEPQRDGVYVRRDRRGNYLGTVETNRYGDAILRAPGGRVQGNVEAAPGYRSPSPSSRER